ncbi:hypothetical protein IU11_14215 [Cellulosimicrobium sp. MM]|nr:hypothetical protein IU11_14215 [Cellulosimicrobium sp. MM]
MGLLDGVRGEVAAVVRRGGRRGVRGAARARGGSGSRWRPGPRVPDGGRGLVRSRRVPPSGTGEVRTGDGQARGGT